MNPLKKHITSIGILALLLSTTSCGLFKKKNRCDTCPKWKDTPAENFKMEDNGCKVILETVKKPRR